LLKPFHSPLLNALPLPNALPLLNALPLPNALQLSYMKQMVRRPASLRTNSGFNLRRGFGKVGGAGANSGFRSTYAKNQQRLQKTAKERIALKRAAVNADPVVQPTLDKRGEMLGRKIGRLQNKVGG